MSNHISILLEQGLSISQILFSQPKNDVIEPTFLNCSFANTEDEIKCDQLFSANIELREEKDLFYENKIQIEKYNNESLVKNIYFHLSKNKKEVKIKEAEK